MWCQAGFQPAEFWDQTPRSFEAIMAGVQNRLEREERMQTALAWTTAAMTRAERLKPLDQYTRQKPKAQSGAEVLAILRGLQASGAPMTIRRLN